MTKRLLALLVSMTMTTSSFAATLPLTLNDLVAPIDPKTQESYKSLQKNSHHAFTRSPLCPLASINNGELVQKIHTLKSIFENTCTDSDPLKLQEFVGGVAQIQKNITDYEIAQKNAEALRSANAGVPITSTNSEDPWNYLKEHQINAQTIATSLNILNNILKSSQCKDLAKNKSALLQIAEVVAIYSQLGLLVPASSGLLVYVGGVATASLLSLMNTLFTPRFNFHEATDRKTFITLNCAFYDIRREMTESGFLDVNIYEKQVEDLQLAEEMFRIYSEQYVKVEKSETILNELVTTEVVNQKNIALKNHQEYRTNIQEGITILTSDKGLAGLDQKVAEKRLSYKFFFYLPKLQSTLREFEDLQLSKNEMLETHFKSLLGKIDIQVTTGNEKTLLDLRSDLLYHLERIRDDIDQSIALEQSKIEVRIHNLTADEYIAQLKEKLKQELTNLQESKHELSKIILRLKGITQRGDFISADGGTEASVDVLATYNKIASLIYGKYGHQFLKLTSNLAKETNLTFNKKYDSFYIRHNRLETLPEEEYARRNLCQEAIPYRKLWMEASYLANESYDFLATNSDLFHKDVKEHSFLWFGKSKWTEILWHYRSAVLAKKLLKHEEVSPQLKEQYLSSPWIGNTMIHVANNRKKAAILQKTIETMNCNKTLSME